MAQDRQGNGPRQQFCENCGGTINPGASFCGNCGAATISGQHPVRGDAAYSPVRLTLDYEFGGQLTPGQHLTNRLLLFVKWLFAIPLYIFTVVYGVAAFISIFLAFWAILFAGRFPVGLFDFVRGFVQYEYRVLAYFPLLLTNHWSPDELHPLRVEIDYPSSNSRLVLVFLKFPSFFLGVVDNLLGISLLILFLLAIPAWWIILITGRYPASWFALTPAMLEWNCRVTVWQNLMRDDAQLFGTTTAVKVVVGIGIAVSLLVNIGNCATAY